MGFRRKNTVETDGFGKKDELSVLSEQIKVLQGVNLEAGVGLESSEFEDAVNLLIANYIINNSVEE